MNFSLGNIAKLIISLGIGILLVWYLQKDLSQNDKEVILQSFRNIKLPATIMTVILAALAVILRALRWEMLLKPLGYRPRKKTLIASIFVLYLANLLFPRLGEVLRCTILNKHEAVPMEKSLGTMVVERIVDVMGMGMIALVAVFLELDKFLTIYKLYTEKKGTDYVTISVVSIVLIIIIVSLFTPKLRSLILAKVMGLMDGIKSIFKLENPFLFIMYSSFIYGIYFMTTYIMYYSLDGLEFLNIESTFLVLTAGTFGVGLTQGGLGAFQLLVSQTLDMYGVSKPIALAYSWLSWTIPTLTLVFFGLISWFYLQLKKPVNEKKN